MWALRWGWPWATWDPGREGARGAPCEPRGDPAPRTRAGGELVPWDRVGS